MSNRFLSTLALAFLFLFTTAYLSFFFNLGGLQDIYYGSKYFRPYAELKQEMRNNQILLLKSGKVLLLGYEQSEVFDPYSKSSRMIGGWKDLNIFAQYVNTLALQNSDVLVWQGDPNKPNGITCRGRGIGLPKKMKPCPLDKIPELNNETQKIKFRDFIYPLQFLQGHTVNLLSDGNILITGGRIYALALNNRGYLKLDETHPYRNNNVLVYNTESNTYKILGHLIKPRYNHHVFFESKNEFIVIGGREYKENSQSEVHPHYDAIVHEIERFDMNSGQSKLLKSKTLKGAGKVVKVDNTKYVLCWNHFENGVTASEVIDLKHPEKNILIYGKPPKNRMESEGNCVLLPNKKIICIGGKEVREIDPINLKSRTLDNLMTPLLSDIKIVNVPKVGFLVFGNSRHLLKTVKTVQRFNYERYVQDLKQ